MKNLHQKRKLVDCIENGENMDQLIPQKTTAFTLDLVPIFTVFGFFTAISQRKYLLYIHLQLLVSKLGRDSQRSLLLAVRLP